MDNRRGAKADVPEGSRARAAFEQSLTKAVLLEGVTSELLQQVLLLQRRQGCGLPDALVEAGALEATRVRHLVAATLGIPAIELSSSTGDLTVLDHLSRARAVELGAVPLFIVDGECTIALSDPWDLAKLDELAFILGKKVLPVFALEQDLRAHLEECYGGHDPSLDEVGVTFETDLEPGGVAGALEIEGAAERPVVRLVNLILTSAISDRATDVHLEPQEGFMVVRFRVDGMLQVKPYRIPREAVPGTVSRIKILARLDIAERRVPQDGKFRITFQGRRIDVRVSSFPSIHGEKLVLRLLDKERMDFTLENIGMLQETRALWSQLLASKEGIILVTGPTGSGKSSTLYASLRHLHTPEVNIVTLEDPVEYELPGITQGQVQTGAGFSFATGLRSILRQDPDVVLVGEIRDRETAEIAVQAALTGHLVLATLHTNDAPSAISRLVDIGLPPYLVGSALRGVLAQRLVRRACPNCLVDDEPGAEERGRLGAWLGRGVPFKTVKGCPRCRRVGYRGRLGVYELLAVSRKLGTLIGDGAGVAEIEAAAGGTYRRLWWDAVDKVRSGSTTFEEIARVLEPEPEADRPMRLVTGLSDLASVKS